MMTTKTNRNPATTLVPAVPAPPRSRCSRKNFDLPKSIQSQKNLLQQAGVRVLLSDQEHRRDCQEMDGCNGSGARAVGVSATGAAKAFLESPNPN